MITYAIKRNNCSKILSFLNYDEKLKQFTIDIPEDVTKKEAPFMMSIFLEKGIRHIDAEWSMRWVKERIIPSSRQNIGQILRENKMERYDEFQMLMKNEGRSCQDELYLELYQ